VEGTKSFSSSDCKFVSVCCCCCFNKFDDVEDEDFNLCFAGLVCNGLFFCGEPVGVESGDEEREMTDGNEDEDDNEEDESI
jgi:hypothetical protein